MRILNKKLFTVDTHKFCTCKDLKLNILLFPIMFRKLFKLKKEKVIKIWLLSENCAPQHSNVSPLKVCQNILSLVLFN